MSYTSPFTGDVVQPTDVSYESISMSANLQLVWPINGNDVGDTPAARIMDVTATSGSLQLRMPPADEVSVGQDALVRNTGSQVFTVTKYNSSVSIASVPVGQGIYIYLTDNSTEAGTWNSFTFGAGTSAANAAALAGAGLEANGVLLDQTHPVSAVVASQVIVDGDRAKTYVWTGGATSITLPLSTTVGNNWFFLLKNNGTGTLTVNTAGGELLDGAVSKAFQPSESAFIVSTGTAFVTVGYGVSTQFEYSVLTKSVTTGNYTLTASEASNTIIIITGVLTGNVNIIVPEVSNFYIASNQTTAGGFTVTIKTAAIGSAVATVPSAGQASLFCDGTNIYNANTTQAGATAIALANGSAGSPSLNFSAETNTGMYRPGAGNLAFSVLGVQRLLLNATNFEISAAGLVATSSGLVMTGSGTFLTGISGGTFP